MSIFGPDPTGAIQDVDESTESTTAFEIGGSRIAARNERVKAEMGMMGEILVDVMGDGEDVVSRSFMGGGSGNSPFTPNREYDREIDPGFDKPSRAELNERAKAEMGALGEILVYTYGEAKSFGDVGEKTKEIEAVEGKAGVAGAFVGAGTGVESKNEAYKLPDPLPVPFYDTAGAKIPEIQFPDASKMPKNEFDQPVPFYDTGDAKVPAFQMPDISKEDIAKIVDGQGRTVFTTIGGIAGGAVAGVGGTILTGGSPLGVMAAPTGSGLGYAMGDELTNVIVRMLDPKTGISTGESFKKIPENVAKGAIYGALGQKLAKLPGVPNKIAVKKIAEQAPGIALDNIDRDAVLNSVDREKLEEAWQSYLSVGAGRGSEVTGFDGKKHSKNGGGD